MPVLDHLVADDLRDLVRGYADILSVHREAINRLNVYPVPDGDTGTNMSLTMASVVAEVDGAGPDMASVCQAISHGSLMGARGNSGVILSQILRGLAEGFRDGDGVDAATLVAALDAAATAAYGAVMKPVEGTILTVVRAVADGAAEGLASGADLVGVLDAGRDRGADALARTPDLLPVLAEAGVVDSGGTGLLLLVDVALHLADGRALPDPPEGGGASADFSAAFESVHAGEGHGGVADLRYEVMYFLEAPDEAIAGFKDVWATLGDSIVVVGGDGLWNCHVHTDDIGAAIEAAVDIGRPRSIRVTDLLEEVEEEKWVREAQPGPAEPATVHDPVPCAVVAVAAGEGIRRIFYSLGVQGIVTGGQTMNPSTAQLLAEVEAAPADEVVILPNNKNIVPVAEQVDAMTSKCVRVVPTRGVAEGFAALLSYDPQAGADANADAMSVAAGQVVAGEVTRAVRDSSCERGPIAEGDWLGIAREGILSIHADLGEAAAGLLAEIVDDGHEIVTVIEGEGATPAVTRHIEVWVHDHRPGCEVEIHHGAQPLYPYLFGIE
ncbi:MAG: DAK2 domain-containing protein [Acidimicrobiales bacterium]|nr:DAK2 domain-containing protein [Acidimicrobiales bacterium]